jgi:hypothetical protein
MNGLVSALRSATQRDPDCDKLHSVNGKQLLLTQVISIPRDRTICAKSART